jgi:hypothetical protein
MTMPYIDHEDDPDFDQDDDDDDQGVTCNRCGEAGCYWQETYTADGSPKQKLFDSATDKPHVCPLTGDDFKVVA